MPRRVEDRTDCLFYYTTVAADSAIQDRWAKIEGTSARAYTDGIRGMFAKAYNDYKPKTQPRAPTAYGSVFRNTGVLLHKITCGRESKEFRFDGGLRLIKDKFIAEGMPVELANTKASEAACRKVFNMFNFVWGAIHLEKSRYLAISRGDTREIASLEKEFPKDAYPTLREQQLESSSDMRIITASRSKSRTPEEQVAFDAKRKAAFAQADLLFLAVGICRVLFPEVDVVKAEEAAEKAMAMGKEHQDQLNSIAIDTLPSDAAGRLNKLPIQLVGELANVILASGEGKDALQEAVKLVSKALTVSSEEAIQFVTQSAFDLTNKATAEDEVEVLIEGDAVADEVQPT